MCLQLAWEAEDVVGVDFLVGQIRYVTALSLGGVRVQVRLVGCCKGVSAGGVGDREGGFGDWRPQAHDGEVVGGGPLGVAVRPGCHALYWRVCSEAASIPPIVETTAFHPFSLFAAVPAHHLKPPCTRPA